MFIEPKREVIFEEIKIKHMELLIQYVSIFKRIAWFNLFGGTPYILKFTLALYSGIIPAGLGGPYAMLGRTWVDLTTILSLWPKEWHILIMVINSILMIC